MPGRKFSIILHEVLESRIKFCLNCVRVMAIKENDWDYFLLFNKSAFDFCFSKPSKYLKIADYQLLFTALLLLLS